MIPYVKEIVKLFAEYDGSNSTAATPAAEHLFKVNDDAESLDQDLMTVYHNFVAKCLFLTKRARPDISTAVAFRFALSKNKKTLNYLAGVDCKI
jgi:hypothetical protein